jgi:hypothetical protein
MTATGTPPQQRVHDAINRYEEATSGIPDSFDSLTGVSIREISQDAAKDKPWTYPLKEAGTLIAAHFAMLDTWRGHLDRLDGEIRADVIEGAIPAWAQKYLKDEARELFDAIQTLLRAVAEYHHGTAGPFLDPSYGYAYELSNSAISPF